MTIGKNYSGLYPGHLIVARKLNRLPGETLINEIANRCFRIEHLIAWLEAIQLDSALMLLKMDEPLEIQEHPISEVHLLAGSHSKLILKCTAVGFPKPQYQWIKDNMRIANQTESTLEISGIRLSDRGVYWCIVSNIDRKTRTTCSELKSNSTIVTVEPTSINHIGLPCITTQPVSPAYKITPGSHIVLECIAQNAAHFQWLCDGNEIAGQTKPEIKLNLRVCGSKSEWCYSCRVSNPIGYITSNNVTITVDAESQFSAEDKIALLIANEKYNCLQTLALPSADVITLAEILKQKHFRVLSLIDLTLTEMRNAVDYFCTLIKTGAYVVFYFVGHGFETTDSYMLPVEASEFLLIEDSLSVQYVIDKMKVNQPNLILIMLDMCRTNVEQSSKSEPPKQTKKEAKNDSNVLISYATSPSFGAYEMSNAKNGIYMQYLQKFLNESKPIWYILLDIQSAMKSEHQSPWCSGNLSKKLTLDDPIKPMLKMPEIDQKWSKVEQCPLIPASHVPYLNIKVSFRSKPCLNVFNNAMDVEMVLQCLNPTVETNLMEFDIEFTAASSEEIIIKDRDIKTEAKSIYLRRVINLQKLQTELKTQVEIKNVHKPSKIIKLELGRPLISCENLWANHFS